MDEGADGAVEAAMVQAMSGKQYALLVCRYIALQYSNRGVQLYREVPIGKSIIGKDRKVDIVVLHGATGRALAIECKYQYSSGTTDEKIPYTIEDLRAMRMPGCVVYAGDGFSQGVQHMLRASEMAAYCLPDPDGSRSASTRELDHVLAMTFGWWDVVLDESKRFLVDNPASLADFELQPLVVGKRRGPKPAQKIIEDELLTKKDNP
jgi:hypothetical protein